MAQLCGWLKHSHTIFQKCQRIEEEKIPEALTMNDKLEDDKEEEIEINRGEWTKTEVKQYC